MENVRALYGKLIPELIEKKLTITCMESMTGGFIASCITDIEGSSGVFRGSYVCYSNEEKVRLGVPKHIIDTYTVYSGETATAMAHAAAEAFHSDIAVGITGNAGNVDPANLTGVPGTVYIAIVYREREISYTLSMAPLLTRWEMKKMTAEKVAETILAELI